MACGGLQLGADGAGGAAWVRPKRSPNFLLPMHALSKVFRGKFKQALHEAIEAGKLPRDPADTAPARHQRVQALRRHDWVGVHRNVEPRMLWAPSKGPGCHCAPHAQHRVLARGFG
jgi:hypothetical protein